MISALITLIVFLVVIGVIYWLVLQLPIPQPFAGLIKIAAVVICILLVLGIVYGGVRVPHVSW